MNMDRASREMLPATPRHHWARERLSVIPPRAHLYQNRAAWGMGVPGDAQGWDIATRP
jgi:hypothetical protein